MQDAIGDTVKLREHPMLEATNQHWKQCWGRGNDLGYGNNASSVRKDKGQPAAKPVIS